jgi:acylphosphatase
MSGALRQQSLSQVTIRGRVQGVGYRAWVELEARVRNLEGWVRNRRDGSVEALFAGPADVVADMVAQCGHGPPSAKVAAVEETRGHPDALAMRYKAERFSVLPTL